MLNSTLCSDYNVMHTTHAHPPKTVRAGTDSRFSQKETWDRMTVIMQGRYVWITKYPIFLFRWKWAVITVYSPIYDRRETYWEETRWIQMVLCLLANILPVLDLMVSLSTVCPIRSYWLSLDPSGATSTDKVALRVQTYVTSVKV